MLTAEQMRTLLERIPARTPLELRDRAMLELAYSCGLRCEEIVNLDIGSFDPETEQLRVLGKGSKERLVPVGEPAQRALRRYVERARHALAGDPREHALFLSKSGRRLSNSDVTRRLGLWVREASRAGASRPTPCATPSPLTCWRAGRTCARSRSCSATPRSPPRRSTRGSTRPACAIPMPPPILVRKRDLHSKIALQP